jgi:DNA-binding MarR family transcriptional regulator
MKPLGAKSIGWPLIHAARLHRARLSQKLSAHGVFAGQEQVLQALTTNTTLTISELAETLRVRAPTVSKMVTRLTMQGLTERHGGGNDARIVRVRLTEEGNQKAGAVAEVWDEVEAELLRGLNSKEQKRLRKMLRKVARNLAEATGENLEGLDLSVNEFEEA